MYRRLRNHLLTALVLLLVTAAGVQGQAFGRVTVVVKNEQGEPLQGVKVTVTTKDLERYREEATTNKKGKATIAFTDATRFYDFHFEYEDFQPADVSIKPEIRQSIVRDIVLSEGHAVTVGDSGDAGTVVYTPAERVFNEGVGLLKTGDLQGARTKFSEALEKDRKMAAAHQAIAGIYIEEKNYEAALESVHRFRELAPDDPNGLFMLYDAHTGLGNQKEADAALKELKAKDRGGDTVALIYNAGVAAVKAGNYAGAKARFQEALELDPTLKEAMAALSVMFFSEKKYPEAATWSERHLQQAPGDARSLRIRWESYRELGDDEKAKAAFKELAAADPKVLATDLYNKGVELFEAGNTAEAIVQYEHALEADPDYARAHYQLGICYIGSGQAEDAKLHLQKFVELAPDDPEAAFAKEMLESLN